MDGKYYNGNGSPSMGGNQAYPNSDLVSTPTNGQSYGTNGDIKIPVQCHHTPGFVPTNTNTAPQLLQPNDMCGGMGMMNMPQMMPPMNMNRDFNTMMQDMQTEMKKQLDQIHHQMCQNQMQPFGMQMAQVPASPQLHSPGLLQTNGQQARSSPLPNQQALFSPIANQQSPFSPTPSQQSPFSPTPNQQSPFYPTPNRESPFTPIANQRSRFSEQPNLSPVSRGSSVSPSPFPQSPAMITSPDHVVNKFPKLPMDTLPNMNQEMANYIVQGKDGKRKVQMKFDVAGYEPEEINVKTDGNVLEVNARHEQKDPNNVSCRVYHKHVELPKDLRVVKSKVERNYDPNGTLTLEGPVKDKHRVKWAGNERQVKLYQPDQRDYIPDSEDFYPAAERTQHYPEFDDQDGVEYPEVVGGPVIAQKQRNGAYSAQTGNGHRVSNGRNGHDHLNNVEDYIERDRSNGHVVESGFYKVNDYSAENPGSYPSIDRKGVKYVPKNGRGQTSAYESNGYGASNGHSMPSHVRIHNGSSTPKNDRNTTHHYNKHLTPTVYEYSYD